jgi:molecular chaperone DnaK (HSP70)
VRHAVVQDITSRSLRKDICGAEGCAKDGKRTDKLESVVLIPRFSSLPVRATRRSSTVKDYQENMAIDVYEGEHLYAKDNLLLAALTLTGIQHGPQGVPSVETVFELDENGILKVTATDLSTNATKSLAVSDVFGFGKLPQNVVEGFQRAVPLLNIGV